MTRKCRSCGAGVEEIGYGKYKCPYCGSEYTEQDFLREGRIGDLETFSLLNKAREAIELEYDFNASLKFSQSVLEKNPQSQEANFLALLAENQIAYLPNEDGKYMPTFLAPDGKPLSSSRYYQKLNETNRTRADEIEKLRLSTLEEERRIKPYDVFISYRQHEQGGIETKEAVWARDIYTELKTNPKTKHLNVFFDQKCLTGSNVGWEPHIYAAIRSAKCMVLLGSSLDNINSRWVKNEWKRFLSYKKRGEKKEIVLLGSEGVNPLLLDEALQEKQMIANTSGRWLEDIVGRVVDICGKPKEEKPIVEKPKKVKKRLSWKAILAISLSCVLALGGAGLGVGLWYGGEMKAVSAAEELISYLPDYEIRDYSQYEDLFDTALQSYDALSDFQKGKVDNRDKLLNALDGFNAYRVEKLRALVEEISPETVESGNLKNAVEFFAKFTAEQRAMLSSDELFALEQYKKVQEVISALISIQDDVINKFGEVEGVKRTYLSIDPAYQALVYNYALVDTFAEQVEFYGNFSFKEVSGGYSISLAEGKTLSGTVELPSRYNGQNVVEIPEGGFKDCRGMTSLVVPETVQTIGKGAFEGCNNLTDVTLPFTGKSEAAGGDYSNGYEKVFGWIFGYQSKSTTLYNAKYGFKNSQASIGVDGAIWQYTYMSYYDDYFYYFFIPTTLRNVTITKQVDVPLAAFNNCRMLEAVTYLATLNNLNDYAFQNCSSLKKFNSEIEGTADLKGNIETVGDYAFAGCTSLTAIEIPESIHVFGTSAFDGDRAITKLTLTNRVTQIGDYAFRGLSLITEVTVYNSTVSIGKGAFQGCNNLADVTLPFTGKSEAAGGDYSNGYEKVFGWIFGYQSKSTTLYNAKYGFKNSQASTGVDGAIWQYTYMSYYDDYFYYFFIPTTLRNVTITKQVDVPLAAFNNCTMLEKVVYTNKIMSQGEYAFQNCVQPKVETSAAGVSS